MNVRRSERKHSPSLALLEYVATEGNLDGSESEVRESSTDSDMDYVNRAFLVNDSEPRSFRKAMQGADAERWLDACREEYSSLLKNHTWELTRRPAGRRVLYSKWVFKVKRLADMSVDRYKARLTAGGDRQTKGLDYDEIHAPVVRKESIRLLLALAASLGMIIHQMDVKTALLNGELEMDVYMQQPE